MLFFVKYDDGNFLIERNSFLIKQQQLMVHFLNKIRTMQFLIYQFESISKLAKLTPFHLQPTLNTDL
ncbi:hypothetical protein DO052_16500 [Escherichia coli]|nr:hypothetical protein [Escherichia coli]